MTAVETADEAQRYDPRGIQDKWQAHWAAVEPFRASDDPADPRERFYLVDMFPYPSGDLHMGHAEAYAIGDAMARYWFLRGKNVLHPIGWDAFGLPAENAAIRNNAHPIDWTYKNIETQAASFRRYATSFDWSRRLQTCDPEYYRWNQWLFLRFFERGLAYRKGGYVNWCPQDQTVLANEQVVNGRCERCGTEVVRRVLTQWYFKITEYADRLLADVAALEGNWPERVLTMQRNWIGRSTGAEVQFAVEGRAEPVTVYTTRPDTLYGATFFVVAADSALAAELCTDTQRAEFEAYLAQVRKLTDIERQATDRAKTGVFLGVHAVNPVNGERIPVWAADYVLPDYGTGAIMAVPAHDQRDLDFARQFGLPVRVVVDTDGADPAGHRGRGAGRRRAGQLRPAGRAGQGRGDRRGSSRSWRRRAWAPRRSTTGCATGCCPGSASGARRSRSSTARRAARCRCPRIRCRSCCPTCAAPTWPRRACRRWRRRPTGSTSTARSAAARRGGTPTRWTRSSTPPGTCSATARPATRAARSARRTSSAGRRSTSTWAASSTRSCTCCTRASSPRCCTTWGWCSFGEPFTRLMNQGQVVNGGKAMSKSLGNGVNLGEQIELHGVDAIRLTMIFAGPPQDDIDWADVNPDAMVKFLGRVRRSRPTWPPPERPRRRLRRAATGTAQDHPPHHRRRHQAVENYHLNVAVARLMELVNAIRKAIDSGPGAADPAVREAAEALAVLLSLFAPYTAEECWEALGGLDRVGPGIQSVARASWPVADPALLVEETVTCVVQVNGKVRDRLEVSPDITEDELRELALAASGAARALTGLGIQRVVVRPPKLVNIVAASYTAQDRHHLAEDGGVVAEDRREGRVVRHQPDVPVALLERLHRGLAVDHGRDDLAVLRALLLPDDHPVAVRDGGVDHRVACHLEHEQGALAD